MPKKARAFINTVWLNCPYCSSSEIVDTVTGSMSIEWQTDNKLECLTCNKEVRMPKTAQK